MKEKQTNIKFIDSLFLCFASIVFCTLFLGKFRLNLLKQIIIGSLLGAIIFIFIFSKTRPIFFINKEKKDRQKHQDECINSLSLYSNKQINSFLSKMLTSNNYVTKTTKNIITATSQDPKLVSFSICQNFLDQEISANFVANAKENSTQCPLLILGKSFTNSAQNFANANSDIYLLNSNDSYNFFCHFNTFPSIKEEAKQHKFRNFLHNIIKKENTKGYIKASLVLIAFSIFSSYKLYYRLFAYLLFLLSIFSFLSNKAKETTNFNTNILNKKGD